VSTNLSKSKYLSGLQCEKKLWLEINDPNKATTITKAQQRIFDQGTEVGIMAREEFPGGTLIKFDRFNLKKSVEETIRAISNDVSTIYEGTFLYDDTYVLADIINKNDDDTWDIIEVKSSTKVKDEHFPDLAVQKYVLEGTGLRINKTHLMHINKDCVYPDLSDLFQIEDVTTEVNNVLGAFSINLQAFKSVILKQAEPDIIIGPQCKAPYECSFKDYCWEYVGKRSVFDIPRIHENKQLELREAGILTIDQIPDDYPLSDNQKAYIQRILNHEIQINYEGIKEKLQELEYPLYFLDFEADNPAIPRFNGMKPYQFFPFQYSCHILYENGKMEHSEYLHPDDTDPRLPLANSLLECIPQDGSIIVYNANFEKRILSSLAAQFEEYKDKIISVTYRIWDLLDIFNYCYKHYGFGYSNSLKNVLPVIAPHLNYETLKVQDGSEARVEWLEMIRCEDDIDKKKIADSLREYCSMDTLAMVEIHKVLDNLFRG